MPTSNIISSAESRISKSRKSEQTKPLVRRKIRLAYSSRAYQKVDHQRKVEIALQEGRGQTDFLPYRPMISVRFSSNGFCSRHLDSATGKKIHALSSRESDLARSIDRRSPLEMTTDFVHVRSEEITQ